MSARAAAGAAAAQRAPFFCAKLIAASFVSNSSVMCVLLSGSLVDVQPMSGLVHRFVFVSSHCIRHASVSCVPDCTPCDLVKMRTRRDSSWLIGAPVTCDARAYAG